MILFDPGLQPERTHLAWRRTALALGVGAIVSIRILPVVLGHPAWALCGVTTLMAAAALWTAAWRRNQRVNAALLIGGEFAALPGAALLATLSGVVVLLGAGCGVILAVRAFTA